jgi:copper transport protein
MWSSRERGAMLAAAAAASLGILLLVGAGSLARTAPARGSASGVEPLPPPARSSVATVADLVVTLSVSPNRPGVNQFTVQAVSSRRPPPAPVDGVVIEFSGGRIRLERTGSAVYSGTGQLRAAGSVRITAAITRAGRRVTAPLAWSVDPALPAPATPAAPVAGQPAGDSDPALRSIVDVVAVPLLGALVLVVLRVLRRRRPPAARLATDVAPGEGGDSQERVLEGVR